MLRLKQVLTVHLLLSAIHRVAGQTASDVLTDLNTISTNIPGDCTADCQPWLTEYGACGTDATSAAFSTCICDPTFIADYTTCAQCLTTSYTTSADPDAALPASSLAELGVVCNAVVSGITSATTTTSTTATTAATTTTTTPITTTTTTTTTTTPVLATTTLSTTTTTAGQSTATTMGTVSSTSTSSMPMSPAAGTPAPDIPFPEQTKSTNVFSGAGSLEKTTVGLGIVYAIAGTLCVVLL